ncbi:hypothetical protein [Corynebacterium sp. TAE3-ERU16]|uniref:hypothetical protein n=1 Tax=Corynebacterium sp. TAE3-ERU16 TaxID=2849493 RepID=UPI001C47A7E5|nr:hypothetical protein [Corynebacterium sp. TAE3-ERU16]MBV7292362.1 hypothetical protein [Corynebacterium sp. TAE3-ERU16]
MSQSVVSLLVSIIALIGVLIATGWNNKAADRRRREDQVAEDARRKADDDRRERERREQLQREDWERQRRAVADCVREITKSSKLASERILAVYFQGSAGTKEGKWFKSEELRKFNIEAVDQLVLLDIEITQNRVRQQLYALWEQLERDYSPLVEAQKRGGSEWVDISDAMTPLSDLALQEIRNLTIIAREAFLECPESVENCSVKPVGLKGFNKETQAEKDNNCR